jgi:hypothetical protein
LEVDESGEALITYRVGGRLRRVLAWGALNAIAPTRARRQTVFKLDYSGGYGKYRRDYWKTFQDACRPYAGPALAWVVTACTAPDGTFWALQSCSTDRRTGSLGIAALALVGRAGTTRRAHRLGLAATSTSTPSTLRMDRAGNERTAS